MNYYYSYSIIINVLNDRLMQGSGVYLERLLPGQLLCWGGAVLLNTIKHPGLRLEEREEKTCQRGRGEHVSSAETLVVDKWPKINKTLKRLTVLDRLLRSYRGR